MKSQKLKTELALAKDLTCKIKVHSGPKPPPVWRSWVLQFKTMGLCGINNNNNTRQNTRHMPSKSVSLSDEHYARLVNSQPENMNFSEWCETLQSEALDDREDEQSSEETTTEAN